MATRKQIAANRRNAKLSTGPTSPEGKAAVRMNALKTGIDAQSQIITGEDPESLEHLADQYHERFQTQGPEEAALIDSAISADWLLRRLRKTEAEIWNRSTAEHAANLFKWGEKAEKYPLAAAFQDKQKVFDRLQHRISAAERSLRASLDTLARLRKARQALSPENHAPQPPAEPSVTPSNQTSNSEIGFVPEIPLVGPTALLVPAVLAPVKPQRPPARVPPNPPDSPHPPVPDLS